MSGLLVSSGSSTFALIVVFGLFARGTGGFLFVETAAELFDPDPIKVLLLLTLAAETF